MKSLRPEALQALRQAAGCYSRGRLAEAESICRRLLSSDPQAVDVANLLALVRKKAGDHAEAERLMQACLAADPRRADILANLANLYVGLGRAADAEQAYRRSLAVDPGFRPARLGLARLLLDGGRAEEAREEARRLLDADERDAEAWNVTGSAERRLARTEAAEGAFRRALDLRPEYAIARHNLGALLARQGRSEEALEQLESAAAAGLRGPAIDFNRASALMDLMRFDEADAILTETVAASPGAVDCQTLLARLRYMRGRDDFADAFRQAVERHPEDVPLLLGYSRALRGAGRFERAAEAVEAASAGRPENPRLLGELAAVCQDAGRYAEALEHARAADARAPGDPGIADILIDALACLGEGDAAWPLVQAARSRDPLNQWYVAMEATVARLRGDGRYEALYDYEAMVRPCRLPTPRGWTGADEFIADLVRALEARHRLVAEPLDQSLRHGTQTTRGLLGDPDPVIRAFLQALEEPIAEYRSAMGVDPTHPLRSRNRGPTRLTGCWSVRLGTAGYHVNHVHSEGWISSAFYAQVPAEVTDTEARRGWIKFGEPRFPVPGASPEKFVQPEVGVLVLFPSYMWHGTTPITQNEPRMTIAFDAVPGG